MAARKSLFVLYLVAASVGILLALELVCMRLNAARGVVLPFAIRASGDPLHHQVANRFSVLDPHLGYAHGEDEESVRALGDTWVNGFVVYRDRPGPLVHPVILALGGSTTDGAGADPSWPEELARLLKDRGIAGTVVNGGTGGYSTNQELLKLIRDGLEFRPDIVISYSGVNDRGEYGELPYPMVHAYQRQVLAHLTEGAPSRLLPNAVAWLRREVLPHPKHRVTSTLGVASSSTLGEQYERNLVLMEAVARARGAAFFGFIQPNAYFRSRHQGKPGEAKSPAYVASLQALYAEIIDLPERLPFVRDFTGIFEPHDDVYRGDGIHTTPKGDAVIAREILDVIGDELNRRS
ncbi:MAG TPA: SGNH/GDSL hydrolase family protein [Myxococcota bacterium]|nr:SGNH/GDSL hydrolase family protein [Myxococcota bacterium]